MRYRYTIIKGKYMSEEGQKYTAYIPHSVQKGSERIVSIRIIQDIFFEYKKAKDFVYLCNLNELSPIHLDDIIEDIL